MEDTLIPMMEAEEAAAAPVPKKRSAIEAASSDFGQVVASSTSAPQDSPPRSQPPAHPSEEEEEPCAKKPKLSKKEMLLLAKARLKEAQEKRQWLLEQLEEEKKAKEKICQDAEEAEEQVDGAEEDDDFYFYGYEYEYHIPPVTGAKESLLLTKIDDSGPEEKVRFLQHSQVCINAVLKVIQGRKRAFSPTVPPSGGIGGVAVGPPLLHAATSTGPAINPPPNLVPMNPSPSQGPAPNGSDGQHNTTRNNNNNGDDKLNNHSQRQHIANESSNNLIHPRERERLLSQPLPPRNSSHNNNIHNNNNNRNLNGGPPDQNMRPPNNFAGKQNRCSLSSRDDFPLNNNSNHTMNKAYNKPPLPPTMKKESRNHSPSLIMMGPGPLPPPALNNKPLTQRGPSPASNRTTSNNILNNNGNVPVLIWKRALAHITAKTLDCTVDLPTKTQYMIRTQDQGVLARIQFFTAPNNPTLLQHNPSKRAVQDHFVPIPRLLSSNNNAHTNNNNNKSNNNDTPSSWKGQDILSFLKHQDERRTTYQPPARRNLPLSQYWAVVEMMEQPLHQKPDSLGYFTATPANSKNNNKNSSTSKAATNDGGDIISFAGKLVWNMTSENISQQQRTAAAANKISKWGEVVSVVTTTGIRNSPLIATIQGFYDAPPSLLPLSGEQIGMPPSLHSRKVILPKSRTIGIIIGPATSVTTGQQPKPQNNNSNNQQQHTGCCQVLFPNGMASGPFSAQALKGARAILYD